MPDAFAYTGLASTFRKAGFVEVARRRSATRPFMRCSLSLKNGNADRIGRSTSQSRIGTKKLIVRLRNSLPVQSRSLFR